MAREVVWTMSRYTLVCEQGMLPARDREILKDHIMGASRDELAYKYSTDVRGIDECIRRYKAVYDAVQEEFPDVLEKRRKNAYKSR